MSKPETGRARTAKSVSRTALSLQESTLLGGQKLLLPPPLPSPPPPSLFLLVTVWFCSLFIIIIPHNSSRTSHGYGNHVAMEVI